MTRALLLPLLLALHAPVQSQVATATPAAAAPPVPAGDNCGAIRQQIEARFRAGGVQPVLAVVEAGLNAGGRVVGTCGSGRRQIVQLGVAAVLPAAERPVERPADRLTERTAERAPERPPEREPVDKIPTECKDGSIVIGPNCDDPRAVRMTSAELAASLAPPGTAAAASAPAAPSVAAATATATATATASAPAPAEPPARSASR